MTSPETIQLFRWARCTTKKNVSHNIITIGRNKKPKFKKKNVGFALAKTKMQGQLVSMKTFTSKMSFLVRHLCTLKCTISLWIIKKSNQFLPNSPFTVMDRRDAKGGNYNFSLQHQIMVSKKNLIKIDTISAATNKYRSSIVIWLARASHSSSLKINHFYPVPIV